MSPAASARSRRCCASRCSPACSALAPIWCIQQQATAGIIIASSIIVARALAPVELAIANWRGFVSARQSWRRLSDFLAAMDKGAEPMALPAPKANLVVENVVGAPPGVQRARRSGHQLHAQGRAGARRHRAERVRQVLARAADRRRLDAAARQGAPRWRRARPMVAGRARPAHRLSAAGRGAVRRHRRAEHRALRAGRAVRGDHRGQPGGRRARHDRAAAGGLRHADRRERRGALGRTAPARSRSRARSIAIRSWSCWTSRIPTSTPTATRR